MAKDYNEEDEKYIELNNIDTSTAAKNFAELLNEKNKTYFLNGNWGSGKSTFLQEVNSTKDVKLVTIDFWRLNDSRSTLETVFAKLHPIVYWSLRLFVILCVALSILMTNVVDLGLSVLVPSWVISISGIIALLVAIHQFFKIKSNGFYSWLLSRKYRSRKKKILVVDDFDRMTNEQQEASYKVFSLLNGKLPIVFVGDIDRLYRNVDNYLSKIIDRRINLPYDLHPNKIWGDYMVQLEKQFKIKLSNELKSIFILDRKNLRDRERFNDFVNLELIKRNKKEYVQIEQQLIVIYLYLFYPIIYENLMSMKKEDQIKCSFSQFIKVLQSKSTEKNDLYPSCYVDNMKAYFINETPSNRTVDELNRIIENKKQLINEILTSQPQSDFFNYVTSSFEKMNENQQEFLFLSAIEQSKLNKDSMLMDFIIQKMVEVKITNYKIGSDKNNSKLIREIYQFFIKVLNETNLVQIGYFINKHKIL